MTKMFIKTVPQLPYSPDLAPCDFWLFPKLRGCCYETIEEMKEAVMKVIDTLTQEDFHGAFQKLLEWYNKCIAAGGDYFKRECVLSIKGPYKKSLETYLMSLVYSKYSYSSLLLCFLFFLPSVFSLLYLLNIWMKSLATFKSFLKFHLLIFLYFCFFSLFYCFPFIYRLVSFQ